MAKDLIPADQVRFFSGSSNPILAAAIAAELGVALDDTHVTRFSNDNLYIQLGPPYGTGASTLCNPFPSL